MKFASQVTAALSIERASSIKLSPSLSPSLSGAGLRLGRALTSLGKPTMSLEDPFYTVRE